MDLSFINCSIPLWKMSMLVYVKLSQLIYSMKKYYLFVDPESIFPRLHWKPVGTHSYISSSSLGCLQTPNWAQGILLHLVMCLALKIGSYSHSACLLLLPQMDPLSSQNPRDPWNMPLLPRNMAAVSGTSSSEMVGPMPPLSWEWSAPAMMPFHHLLPSSTCRHSLAHPDIPYILLHTVNLPLSINS